MFTPMLTENTDALMTKGTGMLRVLGIYKQDFKIIGEKFLLVSVRGERLPQWLHFAFTAAASALL